MMHDPPVCLRRWAVFALSALALSAVRPAAAQSSPIVMLGSDYFQTAPGTFANLPLGPNGSPVTVDFMGVPLGSWMGNPTGNADTVVQRQADAPINPVGSSNPGSIPIQIVALSMESTAPVNIGGSFFDIFVTLDPHPTGTQDMGSMTIFGTTAGGTFNSSLDIFFDVTGKPTGGGSSMSLGTGEFTLSQNGAPWSPIPPSLAVLVKGSDVDLPGTETPPTPPDAKDQNANLHPDGVDANEVDFFPSVLPPGVIIPGFPQTPVAVPTGVTTGESDASKHDESHFVVLAKTPEPSSLLLFGAGGLVPLACAVRRRRA